MTSHTWNVRIDSSLLNGRGCATDAQRWRIFTRSAAARYCWAAAPADKGDHSMGRYRPPAVPGSKYITAAGAARLRAELDQLWRRERPQVTAAVAAAAAQGDRSENAEYIYGKRRLREVDRRVRFLRMRLTGMTVVDRPPDDRGRVYFGARVTLVDAGGAERVHRIVG